MKNISLNNYSAERLKYLTVRLKDYSLLYFETKPISFRALSEVKCSVFSLCPGPVNSNIAREAPGVFQPLLKLVFGIFFRSPKKACQPVIYLAASEDMEGRTGDYMFLMQPKAMDEKAVDPENGRRLWELSEKLLKKIS